MADSLPSQSIAFSETAPASLQDAPSEATAVDKFVPRTNGHSSPAAAAADTATQLKSAPTISSIPDQSNVSVASTEKPSATPQAAPVQATTDKPNGINGTNGVNVDHFNSTKTAAQAEDDTSLFSASLMSPEVAALLPEGYSMRPLRRSDYNRGFLDTLRVLTTVGSPSYETFSAHFDVMASMPSTYHTLVILDSSDTVVGTGAVVVERKFIHNMGLVGHIEDIAVAKNQQGKKLGLRIIQALDYVAEQVGCYKCILDCSEANEGFYVKCGFKRAGLEMAHYYGRD